MIKVMASIEMTTSTHAKDYEEEDYETIGEIAFKRFFYLLDSMKKEEFVGFQWKPGRKHIPTLQVFSSNPDVKPDIVRWAFPANEVRTVEKTAEKAVHFEENRHIYFLEPDKPDEEAEKAERNQWKKAILPAVNSMEVFLALRAEQAILRIVAFPREDKNTGVLILISMPKEMSIRLKSVLTIYFTDTKVKSFGELKKRTAEAQEQALIDSCDLLKPVSYLLNKCLLKPKNTQDGQEKYAEMTVEELDFTPRTYCLLKRGGVSTLGDLVSMSDEELMNIRNMGKKSFFEIRDKLDDLDSLGMLPPPKPKKAKGSKKDEEEPKPDPMAELDRLIGLREVKEQARKIAAFARMQQDMKARKMEVTPIAMNMEFTGNPGTAKTTVARIMAGIFHQLGILSSPNILEVGRGDLVAEYVGQTAVKVQDVFAKARGKVLFIDEAYSLVDGYKESFGDEAISTIVQEMENHRDETIVIFAGYPEEMAEFMSRNPGLRSRVPFHLSFSDYSAEEMGSIAELEAGRRQFTISETARAKVVELCGKAAGNKECGNGRFSRNLVENAIMNFAVRAYGPEGKPEGAKAEVPSSAKALEPVASSQGDAERKPEGAPTEVRFELIADDFTMPKVEPEVKKEHRPIGFRYA